MAICHDSSSRRVKATRITRIDRCVEDHNCSLNAVNECSVTLAVMRRSITEVKYMTENERCLLIIDSVCFLTPGYVGCCTSSDRSTSLFISLGCFTRVGFWLSKYAPANECLPQLYVGSWFFPVQCIV